MAETLKQEATALLLRLTTADQNAKPCDNPEPPSDPPKKRTILFDNPDPIYTGQEVPMTRYTLRQIIRILDTYLNRD